MYIRMCAYDENIPRHWFEYVWLRVYAFVLHFVPFAKDVLSNLIYACPLNGVKARS